MDIRIVTPSLPITMPDPLAVALGGAETATLQLARCLAGKGHRVVAFCHTPHPVRWEGVMLAPLAGYIEMAAARAGDLLLLQQPWLLERPHTAKAAFFWAHDVLAPGHAPALMRVMAACDRLVTVSAWQKRAIHAMATELAEGQFLVSRNGIDLALVASSICDAGERDPYRIVYASRPERGLEVLLGELFPRILAEEPRATLHLAFYDWSNPATESYHRRLQALAEPLGERVVHHGELGKRDLYRLLAKSGLALYPTPAPDFPSFNETSCVTAMEAMACGLPWVSTDRGALPETMGDAGLLVPLHGAAHAADHDVPARLAAAALRVIRDQEYAERLRQAGLERAQGLGWDEVADQLVAAARESADRPAPAPRAVVQPIKTAAPQAAPVRPVVAIATPAYGGVQPQFAEALVRTHELQQRLGIGIRWEYLAGCSLLPSARNQLAAHCMADPEVTHILWIDSDISWHANDVARLLEHDVDFVCGLYPFKQSPGQGLNPRFVFQSLKTDDWSMPRDRLTGLLEVTACGAGFMLTKRTVYERLAAAYPESKLRRPPELNQHSAAALAWHYNFFPVHVEDGGLQSEDVSFCRQWRATGGKIWADLDVTLTHYGTHAFSGDPLSMFEQQAEQAA